MKATQLIQPVRWVFSCPDVDTRYAQKYKARPHSAAVPNAGTAKPNTSPMEPAPSSEPNKEWKKLEGVTPESVSAASLPGPLAVAGSGHPNQS
jgi:hypothetical protein